MGDKTSPLDDEAPFLTWRALHVIVALSLLVDIAALAALCWIYR
jgi:hypothetical protein